MNYCTPNPTDVVRRLPSNIELLDTNCSTSSGRKPTALELPFLPALDDADIDSSSPQCPMMESSKCTPLPRKVMLVLFEPRAPTIYLKPRTTATEKTYMSIQLSIDMKVTKLAFNLTMSLPFLDENSPCNGNLLHIPVLLLQVRPVMWKCKAKKLKITSQQRSPPQVLIRPRQMADTRRQLQPRNLPMFPSLLM
jgi:hypothetical protein